MNGSYSKMTASEYGSFPQSNTSTILECMLATLAQQQHEQKVGEAVFPERKRILFLVHMSATRYLAVTTQKRQAVFVGASVAANHERSRRSTQCILCQMPPKACFELVLPLLWFFRNNEHMLCFVIIKCKCCFCSIIPLLFHTFWSKQIKPCKSVQLGGVRLYYRIHNIQHIVLASIATYLSSPNQFTALFNTKEIMKADISVQFKGDRINFYGKHFLLTCDSDCIILSIRRHMLLLKLQAIVLLKS